jgi:nickel-dependent lactate racemase
MLPLLLAELAAAGVADRDVFVVFATGTHRAHSQKEQEEILGPEIARRLRLYDHDAYDPGKLVMIGTTSRGTPVWINRRVFEADRVILTGEIIFHLIAGYSGGRKSLVPGVAGQETITRNHSLILDPHCEAGRLGGNPAHEDLMEACRLAPPDFLLNVILSSGGRLLKAVAGHYDLAHQAGCQFVDEVFRAEFDQPFDVVIASAGGFPLDIDLRQAHKGMENACRALGENGALLYFAECSEGSGSRACEEWASKFKTAVEMERELRKQFQIGAHKAYWLARLAEKHRIFLMSELPDALVRACRLTPCHDPDSTFAALLDEKGSTPRVAFIPSAGFILPCLSTGTPSSSAMRGETSDVVSSH